LQSLNTHKKECRPRQNLERWWRQISGGAGAQGMEVLHHGPAFYYSLFIFVGTVEQLLMMTIMK